MKNLFTFLAVVLFTATLWAQAPEKINYQAVIKNSSGELMGNQSLGIQIEILEDNESGTPVYTETHAITTNASGLVNLAIGEGTTSDDFSAIEWGTTDHFIKISIDTDGGTSYEHFGTSQLLSVPYALHANTTENVPDNSITSVKILNGEVSNDDVSFNYAASSSKGGPATSIANNSVTSATIVNGTVQNIDLRDGATLLEILDDDGSGSGLDADRLDGQNGSYYYTPKVAFLAYNSASDIITNPGTWVKVEFNSEIFNIGNAFNNATDKFIAPCDGVYHFTFKLSLGINASYINTGYSVNGGNSETIDFKENMNPLTGFSYLRMKGSFTLRLNSGDSVSILCASDDASYVIRGASVGTRTCFSGFLVFAE